MPITACIWEGVPTSERYFDMPSLNDWDESMQVLQIEQSSQKRSQRNKKLYFIQNLKIGKSSTCWSPFPHTRSYRHLWRCEICFWKGSILFLAPPFGWTYYDFLFLWVLFSKLAYIINSVIDPSQSFHVSISKLLSFVGFPLPNKGKIGGTEWQQQILSVSRSGCYLILSHWGWRTTSKYSTLTPNLDSLAFIHFNSRVIHTCK